MGRRTAQAQGAGIDWQESQAARLKVMTDQGTDPRQVIADAIAAKEAKAAALSAKEAREVITVGNGPGLNISPPASRSGKRITTPTTKR